MKYFKALDKIICKFQEIVLSFSILIMAAILIGNVIARAVFNNSWSFAEEVGQFLLLFVTFVGSSYGARKGRHIRMSGVFDLLPYKTKKILIVIINLFTSCIMFFLTYYSIDLIKILHKIKNVSPALRIPIYIIYIAVPIGLLLSGIEYAKSFVKNILEKEIYISAEKIDVSENME